MGPTFACIIGGQVFFTSCMDCFICFQFKALMDGDRYFYRHTSGPEIRLSFVLNGVFKTPLFRPLTGVMLDQIKQRRLSDIICENTDIATIADNVFVLGSDNSKVECSAHRKLDLEAVAKQLEAEL